MARIIRKSLDMSPGFVPPVIHVSQYDSDFTIVFTLYSSFGDFTLSPGTTAEVRGTKRSGTGYSADAAVFYQDKTVTVNGDNQMTAVAGKSIYEIVLFKSGKQISSTNFILLCEPAALDADTIKDTSVIKEFTHIKEDVQTAKDAADRAEAAAESVGRPTDEQAQAAVNTWLNAHPEATTTVQDGSITEPKLANSLKNSLRDSINSKSNTIILATWHDYLSRMDEYAGSGDKRTNRFYTSIDGLNFVEFNRDIYPLEIHSETTDSTIGAPSLVYWNEYFMLISSSGLTDATHDATIGVSKDLVNWDWYDYTLGVRFDEVTPIIYAPELCVLNGDLYVVEAISIDNVGVADYAGTLVENCRTYFSKVLSFNETDGFTFDTAQLIDFYGDDTSNIDATIIYDAEKNLYYALVKNEYYRNIQSFSSPDLQTWSMLNDHVSWRYVEAPSVCYYGGTYHVYIDASRKRSGSQKWIYHLTTDDFVTFTNAVPISAHCKFTVQHGSVFTLSNKDAIDKLQKINDFAVGGIGKAPKKEILVFYTDDIRTDAASGNTRTINYVSVCPNTEYKISLNRDGVITYLDNAADLDFVRIAVAPNVTSGSLTIVNSGAGETYTAINESVEINKNVREIILYKSSVDGILHLMPTREYKTGVITEGTNTTLVSYVCKKEGDSIQVQARITANSALSSGNILFNIPSGFRPSGTKYAIGCRTNDFTNVLVVIEPNGTVKPFGSTTLANGVTAIIECSYIA